MWIQPTLPQPTKVYIRTIMNLTCPVMSVFETIIMLSEQQNPPYCVKTNNYACISVKIRTCIITMQLVNNYTEKGNIVVVVVV